MVMASIDSIKFNWKPNIIKGDDVRVFAPNYIVREGAETTVQSFRSKFADLPSAGIWENRTESDEELLEEIGSGWRDFAAQT